MSGTRDLDELIAQVSTCIEAAYDKGYKAAKQDVVATGNKSEYERGLNDAEKARLRLVNAVSNGGLSEHELKEIFDFRDYGDVLTEYTISEIIDKIREYDERKQQEELKKADDEIHVGDEIYQTNSTHKYIVTAFLDNGGIFVLGDDGFTVVFTRDEIHKTGRNYPIKAILKELGNGEE
jgi:hypothetical protein